MSEQKVSPGPIVAAVRFDRNVPHVTRAALWLAKRRGTHVHLLHVFNPATPSAVAELAGLRARLERKATAYGRTGVPVTVEVQLGAYPETLIEYATTQGASMILVGSHNGPEGWFKANLRPVFHLLGRSDVPVLVLPHEMLHGDRRDTPLRILLADDLTEDTKPAIAEAASLVTSLAIPVDLVHVHVESLPAIGFALSPDYQLDVWPGLNVRDRLVNEHHEALKLKLRERAVELAERIEANGGRYHAELWHGNVVEEITRAAQALGSDLTIFGRHQFLHRQPLSFGQMPFDAMLKVDSAVLVAPQHG